jgi:hypothetical protein
MYDPYIAGSYNFKVSMQSGPSDLAGAGPSTQPQRLSDGDAGGYHRFARFEGGRMVDGVDWPDGEVNGQEESEGEDTETGNEHLRSRSGSDPARDSRESPKKKPRVTLARGGACVACR